MLQGYDYSRASRTFNKILGISKLRQDYTKLFDRRQRTKTLGSEPNPFAEEQLVERDIRSAIKKHIVEIVLESQSVKRVTKPKVKGFEAQLSRDSRDKAFSHRQLAPPLGSYNPNYELHKYKRIDFKIKREPRFQTEVGQMSMTNSFVMGASNISLLNSRYHQISKLGREAPCMTRGKQRGSRPGTANLRTSTEGMERRSNLTAQAFSRYQ